jgi:hypothetical protein
MIEQDVTNPAPFAEHLHFAVRGIRGSLTELLASVGADATRPQEISRRFGLKTKLAWQVSKIVNSRDDHTAIEHLPGKPGVEILHRAFQDAGANPDALKAVRSAMDDFARVVEIHTDDRATLELMLTNLGPARAHAERLEASRKLAFQGNSATWGIQARVRVGVTMYAPNHERPDLVDWVLGGGMDGLRRLRPGVRWPLFHRQLYNDDGTAIERDARPLDPKADTRDGANGLPLMEAFCSNPLPEVNVVSTPHGKLYELAEGPIGNTGAVSCTIGSLTRRIASTYRDEHNKWGEASVALTIPTEWLIFDMYLHEDMPRSSDPKIHLFSQIGTGPGAPLSGRDSYPLPVPEPVQDLGQPPVAATPHLPRYSELVASLFEHAEWDPAAFHGYRFVMRYPPIGSLAVMRFELLERPR